MRVSEPIRLRIAARCAPLALLAAWAGCSASAAEGRASGTDAQGTGAASGGQSAGTIGGAPGTSTEPPPLPPEVEKESSFELPVQSGRWVWSANPDSGRVSVIDTRSLTVQLARAGFAPTYLAPLRAQGEVTSAAIVLNAKSDDATLFWRRESGITTATVPTHVGANAWAVSPAGRWAIAWTDANAVKNADPADSFQDITVIDTAAPPRAVRLSVGYRPNRIFFQADEARAFVVSDPGISIIELALEPSVSSDVALSESPNEKALDVSVIPDGSSALFRVEGSPRLGIVKLPSGERTSVTLSGPITDLDLVADGTAAIAVVRGRPISAPMSGSGGASGGSGGSAGGLGNAGNSAAAAGESAGGALGHGGEDDGGSAGDLGGGGQSVVGGSGAEQAGAGGAAGAGASPDGAVPPASGYGLSEVAVLSIADVLGEAQPFDRVRLSDLVGSVAVSSDGTRAVLYTTASELDRVTVLNTDPKEGEAYLASRPVGVRAPVNAVFIAPDTTHALLALRTAAGAAIGGAFGIVPLLTPLGAKIQPTDAPITGVAFAPPPSTSSILTAALGKTAYLVHFPALRVDSVPLPSLPLASGIVPAEGVGYVAQKHPEGRISLINLESGEPRTLSGFELAGAVNDGK